MSLIQDQFDCDQAHAELELALKVAAKQHGAEANLEWSNLGSNAEMTIHWNLGWKMQRWRYAGSGVLFLAAAALGVALTLMVQKLDPRPAARTAVFLTACFLAVEFYIGTLKLADPKLIMKDAVKLTDKYIVTVESRAGGWRLYWSRR